MEKEYDGTREMLRKSASAGAPAELEGRIMQTILAIADKRAKRRVALSALLRFAAIVVLSILLAQICLPAGTVTRLITAVGKTAENSGEKLSWLLGNSYFLLPLVALFVFSKIYRIKVG